MKITKAFLTNIALVVTLDNDEEFDVPLVDVPWLQALTPEQRDDLFIYQDTNLIWDGKGALALEQLRKLNVR